MLNYDWNFSRLTPYWNAFAIGTLNTVFLTLVVILIGTLIGSTLSFFRHTSARLFLSNIFDILRALPPLVWLLFLYYLMTRQILGFTVGSYIVCIVAFSLNLAAFVYEVVSTALDRIPRDLVESGLSLGMTNSQVRRVLVIPFIVKETMPTMMVLYIGILKMTSIASVINVRELVYSAQSVVAENSRSLETWVVVGLIYLTLVIPCLRIVRMIERRQHKRQAPVNHV